MNEMNEIKGGKGEREKGNNRERIRKKEGKRKKIKKKRAKGKK